MPSGPLEEAVQKLREFVEGLRREADQPPLVCFECGETSEGSAHGWRALLTIDDQVATHCPDCAEAGFGSRSDRG